MYSLEVVRSVQVPKDFLARAQTIAGLVLGTDNSSMVELPCDEGLMLIGSGAPRARVYQDGEIELPLLELDSDSANKRSASKLDHAANLLKGGKVYTDRQRRSKPQAVDVPRLQDVLDNISRAHDYSTEHFEVECYDLAARIGLRQRRPGSDSYELALTPSYDDRATQLILAQTKASALLFQQITGMSPFSLGSLTPAISIMEINNPSSSLPFDDKIYKGGRGSLTEFKNSLKRYLPVSVTIGPLAVRTQSSN